MVMGLPGNYSVTLSPCSLPLAPCSLIPAHCHIPHQVGDPRYWLSGEGKEPTKAAVHLPVQVPLCHIFNYYSHYVPLDLSADIRRNSLCETSEFRFCYPHWLVSSSRSLLMENWFFLDPPRWTVDIEEVDGLEVKTPSPLPPSIPPPFPQIRNCEISARRTSEDHHGIIDITAFNTDGFDVSGKSHSQTDKCQVTFKVRQTSGFHTLTLP